MKSSKEQIYELVKLQSAAAAAGVSTQAVGEKLGIQRTNASKFLNELVKEGRLQKSDGRPVLYRLPSEQSPAWRSFDNLTGRNGSLKRVIRLVEAAVLYPGRSLPFHISGARGTGKSLLAELSAQFAKESGVLPADAPIQVIDCGKYRSDESQLGELFTQKSGILIANDAQLLSVSARNKLCEYAEQTESAPLVVAITDSAAKEAAETFRSRFPITAELPSLPQRPLSERLELIRRFFTLEAARAGKTLIVSSEVLCCLLLYDAEFNIVQIKGDIKTACAIAYVREYSAGETLEIFIGDFDNSVRKGFLHYSAHRDEVERLIASPCKYAFREGAMEMTPMDRNKLLYSTNMYHDLDEKAEQLRARGMAEKDIVALLMAELEAMFNLYRSELLRKALDLDQLGRLVDQRVIDLTEDFLLGAAEKFSKSYPSSVHYSLCLHIDSVIKGQTGEHHLSAAQISGVFDRNREEYLYARQFAAKLEKEFDCKFSVEEATLITMFLTMEPPHPSEAAAPTLLFVQRGAVASALAEVVREESKSEQVYSLDIPSDMNDQAVYPLLKRCIAEADRGAGVVVLYDREQLQRILRLIRAEQGSEIRMARLPLVDAAIQWAKAASVSDSVDQLYMGVLDSISLYTRPRRKAVVTLCSTGKGGAVQLQRYLERNAALEDCEVIPLSMADRDALRDRLAEILQTTEVKCIIGASDPKLFALPFLPVSELIACPKERLTELVQNPSAGGTSIDLDEVYAYLQDELEHVQVTNLRSVLPGVMESIRTQITPLQKDAEIGLFIHLACCVNRLLGKEAIKRNMRKEEIYRRYPKQFKSVITLLGPLEKAFGVIFTDDEVANILTIIYQL